MSEPAESGLWEKLRRRKVVQWGIAYVAAGWGLLQGLGYVAGAFHWPEHVQRFAIIAFIVGLPIALVVAWYHGDRGQQKVSGAELAILTVLLLIGGGMFWLLGRLPAPAPVQRQASAQAEVAKSAAAQAAAASGPSIAVLPFVNMSGDKENEYFSDGISEELLNVLVRVPGLGVASRTSSFAYKGSKLGTAEIAQELKVNHVLEGSVRKSGNRVRITAQLIDAQDDRHLWSQTYDRELNDIFAIQGEIANSIVDALQAQLGSRQVVKQVTVRADTGNLQAYDLYLKARELFISRSDVGESIRLFERVTQMDPGFARGWEGLAAAASVAGSWGIRDRDYDALATAAAHRALELDSSLSMPWAALANVAQLPLPADWKRVLDMFDRAVAADPRNTSALLWRGIAWVTLGFFDRAIEDFDRCRQIDPKYYNCTRWQGLAYVYSGNPDGGMSLFEQTAASGFVTSHSWSFVPLLLRRGDRVGAMLLLQRLGASPAMTVIIIKALESPRPLALTPAEQLTVDETLADHDNAYNAQLGTTLAYYWLQQYDRIVTSWDFSADSTLQWEYRLPGFLNSPGFKAIVRKQGIDRYWREHGFPPQCRPVGKDDFTCD